MASFGNTGILTCHKKMPPNLLVQTRCFLRFFHSIPGIFCYRFYSSKRKAFCGELKLEKENLSTDKTTQQKQGPCQGSGKQSEILYLNASGADKSFTSFAFREFEQRYSSIHPEDKFVELNLWNIDLLRYNLSHVQSKMRILSGNETTSDQKNIEQLKTTIDPLFSCNKLIISSPMWNFTVPYILKQYIDIVVQPGVTFRETQDGPVGLIKGKPLLMITSCGGDYSKPEMKRFDFLTPYLECIFGLIGFTDVRHINISNTASLDRGPILEMVKKRAYEEAVKF